MSAPTTYRTLNEAFEALIRLDGAKYNDTEKTITISNVDRLWEWVTKVKRDLLILYLRFFIVDTTSDTAWLPISKTCMRWLLIGARLQQFPPVTLRVVYHLLLTTHERTRELPLTTRLSEARAGTLVMPEDLFKEEVDYDAPLVNMVQVKRIINYITNRYVLCDDAKPTTTTTTTTKATPQTTTAAATIAAAPPVPVNNAIRQVPVTVSKPTLRIVEELVPLFEWPIYGLTESEEATRDSLLKIGTMQAIEMAKAVGQPILCRSPYVNIFMKPTTTS